VTAGREYRRSATDARPLGVEQLEAAGLPGRRETERAVLGLLLTGGNSLELARIAGLTERAFDAVPHQLVFRALREMLPENVSLSAVSRELENRGDLDCVGGNAALAGLMEAACAPANLAAEVRVLLTVQQARTTHLVAREVLGQLRAGDDAGEVAARGAAALADLVHGGPGALDLVGAARAFEQLEAHALKVPESLLGDGLLCLGDLVVFAGQPGIGKSRLMLEQARAIARGEPWLGWCTSPRPRRVGYLAAEFTAYRFLERCTRQFAGRATPSGPAELLEAFRALELAGDGGAFLPITGDALGRPLDLVTEAGAFALEQLIRAERLDLVVLDPLSRLMGGREETNEVFGQLVARLDRVRFRTGAALVLVHHESKPGNDRGAARDPLYAVRGGTVLVAAANLVLSARKTSGGLRQLVCAKANHAAEPDPVFYRIPEGGGPTAVEQAPAALADANRGRVRAWALEHGAAWITRHQAAEALGMDAKTAGKHLTSLAGAGILEHRKGPKRADLYRAATGNGEHRGDDAASPMLCDGLPQDAPWK